MLKYVLNTQTRKLLHKTTGTDSKDDSQDTLVRGSKCLPKINQIKRQHCRKSRNRTSHGKLNVPTRKLLKLRASTLAVDHSKSKLVNNCIEISSMEGETGSVNHGMKTEMDYSMNNSMDRSVDYSMDRSVDYSMDRSMDLDRSLDFTSVTEAGMSRASLTVNTSLIVTGFGKASDRQSVYMKMRDKKLKQIKEHAEKLRERNLHIKERFENVRNKAKMLSLGDDSGNDSFNDTCDDNCTEKEQIVKDDISTHHEGTDNQAYMSDYAACPQPHSLDSNQISNPNDCDANSETTFGDLGIGSYKIGSDSLCSNALSFDSLDLSNVSEDVFNNALVYEGMSIEEYGDVVSMKEEFMHVGQCFKEQQSNYLEVNSPSPQLSLSPCIQKLSNLKLKTLRQNNLVRMCSPRRLCASPYRLMSPKSHTRKYNLQRKSKLGRVASPIVRKLNDSRRILLKTKNTIMKTLKSDCRRPSVICNGT